MKEAATINRIVTVAKIVPILVFIIVVAVSFKAGVFHAQLLGRRARVVLDAVRRR